MSESKKESQTNILDNFINYFEKPDDKVALGISIIGYTSGVIVGVNEFIKDNDNPDWFYSPVMVMGCSVLIKFLYKSSRFVFEYSNSKKVDKKSLENIL